MDDRDTTRRSGQRSTKANNGAKGLLHTASPCSRMTERCRKPLTLLGAATRHPPAEYRASSHCRSSFAPRCTNLKHHQAPTVATERDFQLANTASAWSKSDRTAATDLFAAHSHPRRRPDRTKNRGGTRPTKSFYQDGARLRARMAEAVRLQQRSPPATADGSTSAGACMVQHGMSSRVQWKSWRAIRAQQQSAHARTPFAGARQFSVFCTIMRLQVPTSTPPCEGRR